MSNDPRRVVVTGMGVVSPLGCDIDRFWSRLIAGQSGVGLIHNFDASSLPVRIAAEVARLRSARVHGPPHAAPHGPVRPVRPGARPSWPSDDAQLDVARSPSAIGAVVASGVGGLGTFEDQLAHPVDQGQRPHEPAVHPDDDPQHGRRPDLARRWAPRARCRPSARPARRAPTPSATPSRSSAAAPPTSCSPAAARRRSATSGSPPSPPCGPCRRATTSPRRRAGRSTATATASSWARAPASSCSRSSATPSSAGPRIYGELVGYGMSSDAFHLTLPDETGADRRRAPCAWPSTRPASTPSEIDYINAHGTSTPPGDIAETRVDQARPGRGERPQGRDLVDQVDDRPLPGRLGRPRGDHLGADHRPRRHPADHQPDALPTPSATSTTCRNMARPATVNVAASNSFGFGGHNATLVFRRLRLMTVTVEIARRGTGPQERALGVPQVPRRPRPGGGQGEPVGVSRLRLSPAHRRPRAHRPARRRRHVRRVLGPPAHARPARASSTSSPTRSGCARRRRKPADRGDRRRHGHDRLGPLRARRHGLRLHGRQHGQRGGREALARRRPAAADEGRPLVAVASSGGARMQEGTLSLMQMAKTTCAVDVVNEARVPFVAVLADPCTGGVVASFVSLADICVAEPGALLVLLGPAGHRADHAREAAGRLRQRRAQPGPRATSTRSCPGPSSRTRWPTTSVC